MRSFRNHLNKKLKDPRFRKGFEKERRLVEIAVQIAQRRAELGLTQTQLAELANLTQQQVSRLEKGLNCHLDTFLRAADVLKLHLAPTEPQQMAHDR